MMFIIYFKFQNILEHVEIASKQNFLGLRKDERERGLKFNEI